MAHDPELTLYRDQITWADHIVFIYPIWWCRPPAMLLGYFDRVFASGFAYKHIANKLYPEKLLKGKQVTCISTMNGSTHYPRLLLNNAHQVLMRRAIFNFVGIKKVKFFEFGNAESKNGKQEKQLQMIERYFQRLARH